MPPSTTPVGATLDRLPGPGDPVLAAAWRACAYRALRPQLTASAISSLLGVPGERLGATGGGTNPVLAAHFEGLAQRLAAHCEQTWQRRPGGGRMQQIIWACFGDYRDLGVLGRMVDGREHVSAIWRRLNPDGSEYPELVDRFSPVR